MNKVLRLRVAARVVFLVCIASAIAAPAQTFQSLASFDGTDGANPEYGSPVQGLDGNFYGTTAFGGTGTFCTDCGTVFKITSGGTLTTVYNFGDGIFDGVKPFAGLVLGTDGNFYGTTFDGLQGPGTVFKITSAGKLTTLHTFGAANDGLSPDAPLVQATDGNFYGTTQAGGTSGNCVAGCGTVFKITSSGTLTTLHSFDNTDGNSPYAGLVQANDGNFYGTTNGGGSIGVGTVFKITPGGTLTTLHSFNETDGFQPYAGLVQAADGNLYGTTLYGGNFSCFNGCGTAFKITLSGTLTTVHTFDSTDGSYPIGGLAQTSDGNFYGTTGGGGSGACSGGCGTLFKMTPGGVLTTLHSFDLTDGGAPTAGLVQATDGPFYGTTSTGGSSLLGTVYRLSVGLRPFVTPLPTSGKVGAAVKILGTNLTGATSVTFNGTAATFTVVSSTEITTTVPTGATTGKVQVTTPHGTLTSNVVFRVK